MRVKVLAILILTTVAGIMAFAFYPSATVAASKPPTNPYGATPIDPPAKNAIILTVTEHGASKSYRFSDLTALKSSVVTINEPFVKKVQRFTVIPLATLFAASGIKPGEKVQTTALNDYVYTNTAAAFTAAQGLLAIKREGRDIPYDQGGPIRIIFPNSSIWSKVLDPWNWSLATIVAR